MNKDNKNAAMDGCCPVTPDELSDAAEVAESPQYLKSQAECIMQALSGVAASKPESEFNVGNTERGVEVFRRFRDEFVFEENYIDCVSAMSAISHDLEVAKGLVFFANPNKMLGILESYLVTRLFESAQKCNGLPDHLSLKTHFLNCLHNDYIDGEHGSFFANPASIMKAVEIHNNALLQEPVQDISMFEHLLGRDGSDAFEVVYSNDIQAIKVTTYVGA